MTEYNQQGQHVDKQFNIVGDAHIDQVGDTVHGDKVAGDKIEGDQLSVGNVSDRAAIAVGRGARADVRIFNFDIRWLPLILVLLSGIVGLSFVIYNLTEKPEAMLGEFNVAVTEFLTVDEDGNRVRGKDGLNLANWIHRRLSNELSSLGISHYELWPPDYTGALEGATQQERAEAAEKLAERINANVIVSGVINQGTDPRVSLEFFVHNRGFENADEITGEHHLGNPILIDLPFEAEQFQGIDNPALSARTNALNQITFGLSLYSIDDFEGAIEYFRHAEETPGWLSNAGKEIVYLLLGNSYARLASKEQSPEYLEEAISFFDSAEEIKHPYPRAAVSKASVLYLQALGDPTTSFIDLELLDEAETRYLEALSWQDIEPTANIESKVKFGLGQIYLIRHQLEGGSWLDQAETAFLNVTTEYENGNGLIQDLAAHSYARLGLIERLKGNDTESIPLYLKASDIASPFYQARYTAQVGQLYATACELEQAIETYDQAIQIAEANGDEESAEIFISERRQIISSPGCE